nr:MAG TPA: hypothetical protein [Caudoviricetes sp.]
MHFSKTLKQGLEIVFIFRVEKMSQQISSLN